MRQDVAIMKVRPAPLRPRQPSKDGCFVYCYLTHKVAALATLCYLLVAFLPGSAVPRTLIGHRSVPLVTLTR